MAPGDRHPAGFVPDPTALAALVKKVLWFSADFWDRNESNSLAKERSKLVLPSNAENECLGLLLSFFFKPVFLAFPIFSSPLSVNGNLARFYFPCVFETDSSFLHFFFSLLSFFVPCAVDRTLKSSYFFLFLCVCLSVCLSVFSVNESFN